jgi:hypothetical protein
MKTTGQLWVSRRIGRLIDEIETAAGRIEPKYYPNAESFITDVFDETLSRTFDGEATEFESDSFNDKYSSILSSLDDIFGDQLRDYYQQEMSLPINESFDRILDLYQKVNKGEELKPSEQTMMRSFKKFVDKGGNAEDFVYDEDGEYDIDEREGMRFRWERYGTPLTFEFSNEEEKDGEIEYYGEITYMGDEFLGVIVTDKRGFIIDYDFYSVLSDEDVRLQDVLKEYGNEAEIMNFFAEEVIPKLRQ